MTVLQVLKNYWIGQTLLIYEVSKGWVIDSSYVESYRDFQIEKPIETATRLVINKFATNINNVECWEENDNTEFYLIFKEGKCTLYNE